LFRGSLSSPAVLLRTLQAALKVKVPQAGFGAIRLFRSKSKTGLRFSNRLQKRFLLLPKAPYTPFRTSRREKDTRPFPKAAQDRPDQSRPTWHSPIVPPSVLKLLPCCSCNQTSNSIPSPQRKRCPLRLKARAQSYFSFWEDIPTKGFAPALNRFFRCEVRLSPFPTQTCLRHELVPASAGHTEPAVVRFLTAKASVFSSVQS